MSDDLVFPGMTQVDCCIHRIQMQAALLANQLGDAVSTVANIATELSALLEERAAQEIDY